jgi:hypothetical protein
MPLKERFQENKKACFLQQAQVVNLIPKTVTASTTATISV